MAVARTMLTRSLCSAAASNCNTRIDVKPVGKRLPPLPSITDILRMYNIRAKRSLSQNFILDPRILNKIARLSEVEGRKAVEVGPGPGGITRALFHADASKVCVVEKDPRFLPSLNLLKEAVGDDRLDIVIGDCLTYNVEGTLPDSDRVAWDSRDPTKVIIVGNLPFNVATPFFIRLLASIDSRSNYYQYGRVPALLTFQHEVALRMAAPPEDPQRCRLSVVSQNYLEVDYMFRLPGGAFVPAPEVDVGVVRITPHVESYIQDLPFKFINKVVTGLFLSKNSRYLKSIKRNLLPSQVRGEAAEMLQEITRIPVEKTPVQLTMEEISLICHAYDRVCQVMAEKGHTQDIRNYMGSSFVLKHIDEMEKRRKSSKAASVQECTGTSTMFDINL